MREIAQRLGVANILEGSVQLIKADGDTHLWADTYDRDLTDSFAVESEVAGRIASSLTATSTGREKQDLARVPTASPEAYDAFLHGLALANGQSPAAAEETLQSFRRAVTLDPNFALAWASLASSESLKYFAGHRTPEQLAIARQATDTATKFQPESSEAHAAAGSFYYYCEQDYDRALEELKQARELSPSSSNAIVMTAMVRRRQGDLPESVDLQLKAAALDPQNTVVWVNLGRSYRGMRQFQKAREMYDRALNITPGEESILAQKIETYLAEGDLDSAAQALAPLPVKLTGPLSGNKITLFLYHHDYAGCIAWIQAQLQHETDPQAHLNGSMVIAFCQVLLGQRDTARPALEKILENSKPSSRPATATPASSKASATSRPSSATAPPSSAPPKPSCAIPPTTAGNSRVPRKPSPAPTPSSATLTKPCPTSSAPSPPPRRTASPLPTSASTPAGTASARTLPSKSWPSPLSNVGPSFQPNQRSLGRPSHPRLIAALSLPRLFRRWPRRFAHRFRARLFCGQMALEKLRQLPVSILAQDRPRRSRMRRFGSASASSISFAGRCHCQ